MILVENLFREFSKNKIDFFCGVPDSVLKNFTNEFYKKKKVKNIILANEGSAIATGIGYYLATKKIPAIYMQNSGLGNSLNPLISIAHDKVYKIPLLLIIGWRGAPNISDEPQHLAQGEITTKILKLCGIKYIVLNNKKDLIKISSLISYSKKNNRIVACLIKNQVLKSKKKIEKNYQRLSKNDITRAFFVKNLLRYIKKSDKIFSSTGYLSRELYHQIKKLDLKINPFYLVGGMGHTSSVSLGHSLNSKKKIICLDGDGSFLMHLGSIVSTSKYKQKNFKYILMNNKSHESVGGQKTNIEIINLRLFAKSVGYKKYFYLENKRDLPKVLKNFLNNNNSGFLEVNLKRNNLENKLPRPKDLLKIKKNFFKS